MSILKKFFTYPILFFSIIIIVMIAVWLWWGGFKNIINQSNLATVLLVQGEKEQEAVSSATPKIQEKEAMFYIKLDEDNKVWCQLCFRKCIIPMGKQVSVEIEKTRTEHCTL